MKKVFWIYFSSSEVLWYPLTNNWFFESYAEILENIEKEWIKWVIVRGKSYLWNWRFQCYFIWNWRAYEKIEEEIKLDLLWNRDSENTIPKIEDLPVLNYFEFDEICRDKIITANMFSYIQPQTILLNDYNDYLKNISKIKTDYVVLKPRFWEWCKWVNILKRNDITEELYESWKDIIMQNFMDSSLWIPWMVEGIHELQIYCINWEYSGSRMKIPAKWQLVASLAWEFRWKAFPVKKSDIPKIVFEELQKIDSKFEKFDMRVYRADFMNTKDWYKIVELNSRPWVRHPDKDGTDYWEFNWNIVKLVRNYLLN